MIATGLGMRVTLLCPSLAYLRDERFMQAAHANATEIGDGLDVSHEMQTLPLAMMLLGNP
jgi:N-acetylornithine carbamoyltransferase